MKFFKIFLSLAICLSLSLSLSFADSKVNVTVNNTSISSDVDPFMKSGTTYVPLRFVSEALKVDKITWNDNSKAVTIVNKSDKILIAINKSTAFVNEKAIYIGNPALLVEGRTFVPIRFVSESLGATVSWLESSNTVAISTQKAPIAGGDSSSGSSSSSGSNNSSGGNSASSNASNLYQDQLYWLSRIVMAEAGGEPFKGKVAVAEVVLNRVSSEDFPNTIWTVIFDKYNGVYQFEPVANGTIYNTPSAECIEAAKTALNGSNYIEDCLFFFNPVIAQSNWIANNRIYYATIGNHVFYA